MKTPTQITERILWLQDRLNRIEQQAIKASRSQQHKLGIEYGMIECQIAELQWVMKEGLT